MKNQEKNPRSVDLFYKNYQLGRLYDKDVNDFYVYNSNKKNELIVGTIGLLPQSYKEEMLDSDNAKFSDLPTFVNGVVEKIKDEKDTIEALNLNKGFSDFDVLYALSNFEFVGENIAFTHSQKECKSTTFNSDMQN